MPRRAAKSSDRRPWTGPYWAILGVDGKINREKHGTGKFATYYAALNRMESKHGEGSRVIRVTSDDGYDRCEWYDPAKFDHEKDPVLTTADNAEQWEARIAKMKAERDAAKKIRMAEMARRIAESWRYAEDEKDYTTRNSSPK